MLTSIEFPRIYMEKDLSRLSGYDYLIYQVDIRCLRREDFDDMLRKFYALGNVKNELLIYYKEEVSQVVTVEQLIKKRIKEELELFDTLSTQVIDHKPSDNLYSLAIGAEYWGKFKKHVMWGALFGEHYRLIGNKVNYYLNLVILLLTIFLGYIVGSTEYFTSGVFLPFILFVTYITIKTIVIYWMFSTLRMTKAIEKLLLNGFYLSSGRDFFTLDLIVLITGLVLLLFL